jgi:hypothetical protein
MPTLYLLNAPICHTPGLRYVTRTIDRETATAMVLLAEARDELTSAIGHDGAAAVLTLVFGTTIPVNRITMNYQPGDSALALQLRQRQPEGVVLTADEVERIGYDLTLIETAPAPVCVIFGSAATAAIAMAGGAAEDSIRWPADIDVAYAGMDAREARDLAYAWARDNGLLARGHLECDLHPEICDYRGPAWVRKVEAETREHIQAHFRVVVPHPDVATKPEVVAIAGRPVIEYRAVYNLASLMRHLGPDTHPAVCGDAIANWISRRDGLRVLMQIGGRSADANYKEGTLEGIMSGWRHMAPTSVTSASRRRQEEIREAINSSVPGLGDVVVSLVGRVSMDAIAAIAKAAENPIRVSPFGELWIGRRGGVWMASVGDLEMSLVDAVPFIRGGVLPDRAAA